MVRERRERKQYTDDWNVPEEELEGKRNFHLEDKLSDEKYSHQLVKHISGHEFGLAYMQQNGFKEPILVKEKAGLGLKVPDASFTIDDVRASEVNNDKSGMIPQKELFSHLCLDIGRRSRRNLDVMDVLTQKNMEMSMKEFQLYWENPNKDKLLNVISLEFSHTRLEHYVEAPLVVRQIDWVDNVWPQHLKELQTESTNVLEDMMYPKVQKYVLMSVKGCYTDFHIDFGGTSVWYHVLKGRKVFWLIPPTSRNLELYEQWVLSGKQGDIFFGDTVEKCSRVVLEAGNTFFIPTGWIHAVYTPEDSLVFGGNFLHSFSIQKQLQIAQVEDTTHVPQKFRYPFFTEMLWYVLDRYVACLLGRSHLALPKEKEKDENDVKTEPQETLVKKEHQHLTQMELHGLKSIVIYLHSLARTKKCVPELVTDPVALIKDMKELVEQHKDDQPDLAVTGKPIISWPRESKVKRKPILRKYGMNGSKSREVKKASRSDRRRRVRCKRCIACTRNDCGKCIFCRDMVKFGGPGRMKQSCLERQCRQPQLPVTSVCSKCEVNGYQGLAPDPEMPSDLMECSICYKILHPKCAKVEMPDVDGITNEDLPNSWECPHCVKEGLHINAKPL
ncbi:unnamed protein product [Darwinula stevensoni]|uniref:[histone H3]-dimethyl-L-lysine(36) demethylase n=1 Tax=Darwinula stevensoni TaxID=69355 RepID=A0A7R9A269_9CRUS|nr:unnamed protein product [Darwinula stevensoni]CAG0879254.1 unnamed protein product [Darwinula stevensoni]